MSDCWIPANELTRLVKLYSMPWEDKNEAFKKLHKNFETKKSQLNVAIRRLQLLESQCQWLERENRMKTLEKMFVKILSTKGKGKRWKFLTAWFREKAKEGPRDVQRFVRQLADVFDSEEETEDSEDDEANHRIIRQMMPQGRIQTEGKELHKSKMYDDGESDDDDDEGFQQSRKIHERNRVSFSQMQLIEEFKSPAKSPKSPKIRPQMIDKQLWTSEPEFESYLCVRIFRPEDLGEKSLMCCAEFGDQSIRVDFPEISGTPEFLASSPAPRVNRIRSPIRRRNATTLTNAFHSQETETQERQQPKSHDCVFSIPEEILGGYPHPTPLPPLTFNIFDGSDDHLLAKAVVDMDDLNTMDLQSLTLPTPSDDVEMTTRSQPTFSSPVKVIPEFQLDEGFKDLKPTMFPLYESRGSDRVCGYLPLTCFWAKREKPRTFNRATESESLNEIIYDLTGFNPTFNNKGMDLQKQTEDRGTSPREPVPEIADETETVPRAEYEKVLKGHVEEIEILRNEYELRLREMADSLHEMDEAHADMQRLVQANAENSLDSVFPVWSRLRSGYGMPPSESNSVSPIKTDLYGTPQPPKSTSKQELRLTKSISSLSVDAPQKGFVRVKHSENQHPKNRQELTDKSRQREVEVTEGKVESTYKLSSNNSEFNSSDFNLPAVFMPTKSRDLNMYAPKVLRHFHATGAHGLKNNQNTTDLPPISAHPTVPIINLYEMRQPSPPSTTGLARLPIHPTEPITGSKVRVTVGSGVVETEPSAEQRPAT